MLRIHNYSTTDSSSAYWGSNFNEPWLLCFPIQRNVLNSLTWVIVSWISSSVFWSLQVYRRHFPKREIRSKISTYETLTPMVNTPRTDEAEWSQPSFSTRLWNGLWQWGPEPKLTPCWNCFFDLLFVVIVIIIEHNGLSQKTLPFCLMVKVPFLSSQGDKPTLPGYEKKKLTDNIPKAGPSWDVLQDWRPFSLCFLSVSSPLFCLLTSVSHNFSSSGSIKEPVIQTLTRWLLWDISPPSSQPTVQDHIPCLPTSFLLALSVTQLESPCAITKDPSYNETKILRAATKTPHRQINKCINK